MAREDHRRRVTLRRRHQRAARSRAQAQTSQEYARIQRDIDRQLRRWSPSRFVGACLLVVSAAVAVNHAIAHWGDRWLPMSMGWQDLLVGYPTAAVLALGAFIVLGQERRPR